MYVGASGTPVPRATVLTRRFAGVMLLVAVAVGSLLVARIGGARVAGTAVVHPGSGAPAVGECVAGIVGPPVIPIMTGRPSPVSIVTVGETSAKFANCSAPHVGEVVAYLSVASAAVVVNDQPPTAATAGADAPGSAAEPTATAAAAAVSDGQWCQMVAGIYRDQTTARYGEGPGGHWAPSIGQRFVAILSAPTPDSTGTRWAACAVLSPRLEPYSGSYVRSLANLPAPAPFGLCRTGEPVDQWSSCVAPHRSQVFGTAVQQDVPPDARLADCRSLIERMTRMQDVTNGGVLRVDVIGPPAASSNGGNFGTPESADPTSVLSCRLTVVGAGRLVGTLVGIGDRPLPMA